MPLPSVKTMPTDPRVAIVTFYHFGESCSKKWERLLKTLSSGNPLNLDARFGPRSRKKKKPQV